MWKKRREEAAMHDLVCVCARVWARERACVRARAPNRVNLAYPQHPECHIDCERQTCGAHSPDCEVDVVSAVLSM